MEKRYKKHIDGHAVITVRIPISFNVDAEQVEYTHSVTKYGELYEDPHFEEEYDYTPEQAIQQDAYCKMFVKILKDGGHCDIEEIIIEEC